MNRELAIHLSKNAKRLPDSVKYKVANNIDPRVGQVIGYFQHILRHPIQGSYVGELCGLHMFTVNSNTVLVRGAKDVIQYLIPKCLRHRRDITRFGQVSPTWDVGSRTILRTKCLQVIL